MSILSRLSLKWKSILLISVPVLAEMVFLSSVAYFVWQGQTQSEKADQLMKQMTDLSSINQIYLEGSTCLLLYGLTHSQIFGERFEGLLEPLQKQFDSVRHGFESRPERLSAIGRWEKVGQQVIGFSKTVKSQLDEGGLQILSDQKSKGQMGDMLKEVNELLSIFSDWEKEDRKTLVAYINRTQIDLRRLLVGGVLINMLLAFLMIRAYRKNLVDRISDLQDNCQRISQHEPLNPQLEGSDELASLDRVLHSMAEKLRENERREIAMVEEAIDIICTIDGAGRFQKANRAAETLWGYTRAELAELLVYDLLKEEQVNELRSINEDAADVSMARVLELSVKTKSGSYLDMRCSIRRQALSKTSYCVFRDVSVEKENELLKDQLVSMVTHDLRTPASSLMAFFSILQQGLYGQLERDELDAIKSCVGECSMLIEIINDFLDLEKIDSNSFSLLNNSVDVSSLFDALCDKMQESKAVNGSVVKLRDYTSGVNINGDAPILETSISGFLSVLMSRLDEKQELIVTLSESEDGKKLCIAFSGFKSAELEQALDMPFRSLVAQEEIAFSTFFDCIRIAHFKSIVNLHAGLIQHLPGSENIEIEFALSPAKLEGQAA